MGRGSATKDQEDPSLILTTHFNAHHNKLNFLHKSQVEAHPYFRNENLLNFCNANDIHVTAYAPLGSPDSASIMGRPEGLEGPMDDPLVIQVAKRLGKSAAQVCRHVAQNKINLLIDKSGHH